ncbi:ribonuclease 2 isoform X3 [Momordica charantia]|uniref:Ribonuclease 2 isoform X3 n=1 Tax=Momordica charantia TaxID=3673 RepID=A0A6J1CQK7_MOMCH|nr:ribonuclease 2 isoform X3 [Momordica charantia]
MILLIFLIQLVLCVAENSLNEVTDAIILQKKGGGEQREFDYFKLALQWPGTMCRGIRHCCSSNGCCDGCGAVGVFTIHGLWPDYNDGSWPSCCTGKNFDEKEIRTLNFPLKKYWPTFSCSSPSTCHGTKGSFWAHEWEKHGTCSNPVVRDEYDYFLTTLNLYFKYNVSPRDCVLTDSQNSIVSAKKSCPKYVSLPAYEPAGKVFNEILLTDSSRQDLSA